MATLALVAVACQPSGKGPPAKKTTPATAKEKPGELRVTEDVVY